MLPAQALIASFDEFLALAVATLNTLICLPRTKILNVVVSLEI
jgi:hypothetical protein